MFPLLLPIARRPLLLRLHDIRRSCPHAHRASILLFYLALVDLTALCSVPCPPMGSAALAETCFAWLPACLACLSACSSPACFTPTRGWAVIAQPINNISANYYTKHDVPLLRGASSAEARWRNPGRMGVADGGICKGSACNSGCGSLPGFSGGTYRCCSSALIASQSLECERNVLPFPLCRLTKEVQPQRLANRVAPADKLA